MTTDIAIRVEGIGKLYRVGERERYRALRDVIAGAFRGSGNGKGRAKDTIWAVRDVSFDVRQGEVVGLIGRNGAGKSTLLKLLARITRPTVGGAQIHGRIGSLLEVGTGFHPELTGRENIFLSGAILGMKRAEIRRKFDEIVAFAEVERFLDSSLKHYSTGMQMRLAFAVAAHLEPEILLVDEVLAVGDAAFQKKCLGKMQDVSRTGRTIIFVSHNMAAVTRLCQRALWVDAGRIVSEGSSMEIAHHYQSQLLTPRTEWTRPEGGDSNPDVSFSRVQIRNAEGRPTSIFRGDEPVVVHVEYAIRRSLPACQIGTRIYDVQGSAVLTTADADGAGISGLPREPGCYQARFTVPGGLLAPGTYQLLLAAHHPQMSVYDTVEQAVTFEISSAASLFSIDGRLGVVGPLLSWETTRRTNP